MPLHACQPHGRSARLWRTFLRCRVPRVSRSRRKHRAKRRSYSLEPSGHALAQEQGETNAAWLVCSSFSQSCSPCRADNLKAK
jgi:hypothetical protein